MGCNCKSGKVQKLNNLDSNDHLQVAFEAYEQVKQKPFEEFDEGDSKLVIAAFYSVYPNAKGDVTFQHATNVIKQIYEQHNGGK